MFITFEGIEGCGKSTQIKLLADRLDDLGREVITTREPGGTNVGVSIREILLDTKTGDLDAVTELLLFSAARRELITQVIEPALKEGKIVLCDRFTDSTLAYQGLGRGMESGLIHDMIKIVSGDVAPDLTIVLELSVEAGLARSKVRLAKENSSEARFEREDINFHERVRYGFHEIAKMWPERVKMVESTGSKEEVSERVFALVSDALSQR